MFHSWPWWVDQPIGKCPRGAAPSVRSLFINKRIISWTVRCVRRRFGQAFQRRSGYPAGIIHPHKLDRASTTRRSSHPPSDDVRRSTPPGRICGRKLLKDGPVLRIRKVSDTATRGGTILSGWRGLPWWKLPQWPLSPQRPSRDLFTHPLTHLRSYWKTLQRFIFRDEPHFQIKWIF